jgi:hypothetical protein
VLSDEGAEHRPAGKRPARCPNLVNGLWHGHECLCSGTGATLETSNFQPFTGASRLAAGLRIPIIDLQFLPGWYAMLGELTNIPTGTLIDMLSIILAGGIVLTASDVTELEQIQRELQRRAGVDNWGLGRPN